nr:hypothetical protein [Tanacetum cinerariifolium]
MSTVKFAKVHNTVAFLSKPTECEGFEQIMDFFNAQPITYALTVNTTIYTSCIKQFWDVVKAKNINGEVQVQALVDGKKVIISEFTVRRDLQLEDIKGVNCLPNDAIFEQLTLMSMVKNLDNVNKFLMYPWFVQVFLDKQLEGMSNHNRIYVASSHTKKIFGNIKRVGKGFSGRETSLFPTMIIQAQKEMGKGLTNPTDPHHTPIILQLSTSQQEKTQKHKKPRRMVTKVPQPSEPMEHVAGEAVNEEIDDSLVRAATIASSLETEQDSGVNTHQSDEDRLKLNELMKLCTTLQSRVLELEKTKTTQALEIDSLKIRVKKLEKKQRSRTHKLKRLYKGRLDDQEDADMLFDVTDDLRGEEVFVQEEVADKDVNAASIATSDSVVVTMTVDEVTLAQAHMEIKSAKPKATTTDATTITAASTRPKAKGLVIYKQEQAHTPTVSSQQPSQFKVQDKGKGIMVEPEKPMKKKDEIMLDEEVALKLQAEFDKE